MASNLRVLASNTRAMACIPIAMASHLRPMASSHLEAMASHLRPMASNLRCSRWDLTCRVLRSATPAFASPVRVHGAWQTEKTLNDVSYPVSAEDDLYTSRSSLWRITKTLRLFLNSLDPPSVSIKIQLVQRLVQGQSRVSTAGPGAKDSTQGSFTGRNIS